MIFPKPFADDILDSGTVGRAVVRAETQTTALDALGTYGPIFRPASYSTAGPSATAAQNLTAITSAIAAAVAAGGGIVAIDIVGTWTFNAAGANPYASSTKYGFEITGSNVSIYVAPGVVLKLADNQQSGATQYFFMFIFRNKSNIRFYGGGTLDCNSQGQTSYSGGYGQQLGGHIQGYDNLTAGNTDIVVDGLRLINTFGNPVNIGQTTANGGARVTVKNNYCSIFGEGIQLIAIDGFTIANNAMYDLTNTSNGDWYEMSNCTDGEVYGNKIFGTITSTGGSCFDLFGSKRIKVFGNSCNGFSDAVSLNPGNGGSICDQIVIANNTFYNGRGGCAGFGGGTSTWVGNDWKEVGVSSGLHQFLSTATGQIATFHGEKFTDCGVTFVSRGVARYYDCEIIGGAGAGLYFNQVSGYTPTLEWTGGKINNRTPSGSNSYALAIQALSSTDYAPLIRFHNADLTGNASGVTWAVTAGASFRNVVFDDCILNTTTDVIRNPASLGSVAVNGTITSILPLMTIRPNKNLVTSHVLVRVTSVSGTPSVTLSVGSVAGSYVDVCPSQTISPTAAGQIISLTLATGAGPAAGAAIYVNVTSAGGSTCRFQFTIEGEEQPEYVAATTPTTTNVSSLVLFLPREGTYWQDTGATTPAAIGDRVARWDTGASGLPRAQQGTAGARPVRQAAGLTNFDNTSIMTLVDSGGSATSVSLTGDFTAYFTGYLPAAAANGWYPTTNSTGTGGFLIGQGGGSVIFQTDAAQVSVSVGSLITFSAGEFLLRFRRTGGVVSVAITGRATEYSYGTLSGTCTLNRVQNWISSMSSSTTIRNGDIIVCNSYLTDGGTEDTLIRNYLFESAAVRLYT